MRCRVISAAVFCSGLFLLADARGADVMRFAAMFADGSRHEGNALTDWHASDAVPKLEGRALFDDANPIRWLRDRSLMPSGLPAAFVETVTGDRLPGVVVGHVSGGSSSFEPLPRHFVVDATSCLKHPKPVANKELRIRVIERFVRRVVWQRRERGDLQPGTVFYRDGRSVAFRSAKFSDGFVNLLLEEGQRRAAFNELAEIHLPAHNQWDAFFDELAVLGPQGETRLMQMETTGGVIVTSSLDRFAASVQGNPKDSNRWIHGLHPAWSLDPLWVSNAEIWVRRVFAPHEIPLSRITPTDSQQSSLLGGPGWQWQANRNIHGAPLYSAGQDFGWGFGVHATSELRFSLPSLARSFRSRVGLDRVAGDGGCVHARVFAGKSPTDPRYECKYLVGSNDAPDTGVIAIPVDDGAARLVLQIDPAHKGRPKGADPLDIRDIADWLDPIVELDRELLKTEIQRRLPKGIHAWQGWTLSTDHDGTIEWVNFPDDVATTPGTFALGTVAIGKPFSLSRNVELGPNDNWLMLMVSRHRAEGDPPKIEIRVNDEPVAEFDVALRGASNKNVAPVPISLTEYQASKIKKLKLAIVQLPGPSAMPVRWQAIRITDQLPTLHQLFEEKGQFEPVPLAEVDPDKQGTALLVEDDKHYGGRSVKITPAGQFRHQLKDTIQVREKPTWGQHRYLRFAFRKFGAGRICLELNHNESIDRPVRYDAGLGDPCWGKATRVWVQQLPNEWIVMTRDLYAEFGALNVTGLTLSSPDGQYALFDHIYLARSTSDLEAMPSVPSADMTNRKARRELARPILDKALPATVAIDLGDGRFGTGVVISADGYVLTAGHIVTSPDKDVTIHLADDRKVKAKTRGIFREMDLGLIKIEGEGQFPHVEVLSAEQIQTGELYVGVAHKRVDPDNKNPAAHIVDIRRVFRGVIWTTFDVDNYSAGGPLIDKDGKLIGIHNRRSSFGGFLYCRVEKISEHLERMKNGEVWGNWYPGTGPMIGVEIETVRKGCKVIQVFPNTPAAESGIKADDIIRKVEGRSVVSLDDIYDLLADNDPGQQVAIEILRGKETIQAKMTLVPRTP